MRNLVPEIFLKTAALLCLCSVCTACGSSQVSPRLASEAVDDRQFRGFNAEGSRGHRLEIVTDPGIFGRASATLAHEGDVWRVSDDDCAAFRSSIEQFRALPSLKPGPYLLLPGVGPETPMASRWNGESWTIRTQLYAPDWSSIAVEMRGGQGPYVKWLSDVVDAIKSCGPPSQNL